MRVVRIVLSILPLLLLLAYAVFEAVSGWDMADVQMGWRAYLPMALGIGLTLVLAASLVGLLIYSNRRGYDRPWTP